MKYCISQWGHDFRPHYNKLSQFRKKFPKVPILAVTATATEKVVNDIINILTLKNPLVVTANFDRPNLYIKCVDIKKANLEYFSKTLCPSGNKHKFNLSGNCLLCKKNRDNLNYSQEELDILDGNLSSYRKSKIKLNEIDFMNPYLEKYSDEKIIIYTNSRKETASISEKINEHLNSRKETKKFYAKAYHAGMSKKTRENIQEGFSSGILQLL